MRNITEIAINLVFWVLSVFVITKMLSFDLLEVEIVVTNGSEVISETVSDLSSWFYFGLIIKAILFYAIVFSLVPKYFSQPSYIRFGIFLICGILLSLVLELFPLVILERGIDRNYIISTFVSYSFYVSIALVYGIVRNQLSSERKRQQLTSEKLQTELKLLRSQINPHFLFNALNNLLAISERSGNATISSGITELSDLLRFLIYDTQTDFIQLQKEVDFIHAYISLHALRYASEDAIDVDFNISGVNETHKIAPSLLIPFVENAFKHGIKLGSPSFISINLQVKDSEMQFLVSNSKQVIQKNEFDNKYSGVGLENVKKRLNLTYGINHKLKVEDGSEEFKIELKLDLALD